MSLLATFSAHLPWLIGLVKSFTLKSKILRRAIYFVRAVD